MSRPPYPFNWIDWLCLWYPPAWLILFNRHWQHYKPDPNRWNWFESGLFLLPLGFYLAFCLRWLRLKLRDFLFTPPEAANPAIACSTEPDLAYQQAFRAEILAPIVQRYFRASLQFSATDRDRDASESDDPLDASHSLIVAMNHAGMCFPWDFVSLGWLLEEQPTLFGQQTSGLVHPFAHPIFFDHPWLKWWLPEGWAQVLGGVRADLDSFETAIAQSAVLLYAPEGWRGLAKGWAHRYQLAIFDSSFVRLSIRYRVPILPVVCLGNEGLHPFAMNVDGLARWFKLPMFPLSPLLLLFALFPSLGVWVVRSRLQYHVQPLWRPWEDLPNDDPPRLKDFHRLANELRSRMQTALDAERLNKQK